MNLFNPRRASFELGYLRNWIQRGISQLVHRQLLAPVIGNKDSVRPDGAHNQHRKDSFATTRSDTHALAVIDVQFLRQVGMNFHVWFRALLNQKTNTSCLITREILIDHAATGEY